MTIHWNCRLVRLGDSVPFADHDRSLPMPAHPLLIGVIRHPSTRLYKLTGQQLRTLIDLYRDEHSYMEHHSVISTAVTITLGCDYLVHVFTGSRGVRWMGGHGPQYTRRRQRAARFWPRVARGLGLRFDPTRVGRR